MYYGYKYYIGLLRYLRLFQKTFAAFTPQDNRWFADLPPWPSRGSLDLLASDPAHDPRLLDSPLAQTTFGPIARSDDVLNEVLPTDARDDGRTLSREPEPLRAGQLKP